jgi:hypothetical protein
MLKKTDYIQLFSIGKAHDRSRYAVCKKDILNPHHMNDKKKKKI